MHGAVATIIVVNISVSAPTIDLISQSGPILAEIGDGCLLSFRLATKWCKTGFIFVYVEH